MRKDIPLDMLGCRASHGQTLPVAVDDQSAAWPLHDTAATRAIESAAQAGDPHPPLMARAGLALARLARALAPHATRTLVLAGPGNNGGDGLVAARLLHGARHPVQVRLTADPAQLPADAKHALRMAASAGVDVQPFFVGERFELSPQDRVIDALLGIGSRQAPHGAVFDAIGMMRTLAAYTLAADLPSGLDPDTGALLGVQAVRAQATLGLLTIKPGCLTAQGRDHAGALWWNDLGQAVPDATALLAGRPGTLPRPQAAHKGRFGEVWLLGGSAGMEGALVLASGAALAAGAGRVLACPLTAQPSAAMGWRAEVMLRQAQEALQPLVLASATVVAGCGGGQAIATALASLLTHAARLVLDADALNAISVQPSLHAALRTRADRGLATVLTPHPLEAARLLGISAPAVQANRLAAACALADRFAAVVVLKGSGTVVAAPGQRPQINPTGNAALSTAGTGDVLAGWLGGLWSQAAGVGLDFRPGNPSDPMADAKACALAATWVHGRAADRHVAAGRSDPLRASDLIDMMAQQTRLN